ncbi:MAG: peroxiredoxin [Leptolyngbya sp. SIO3F4]|nr:peroxiredoxin [Leptolyngbya sp. SIO3F4]
MQLPNVSLLSTGGANVRLVDIPGCVVIFCYPMTGQPGRAIPVGWADIPGAAGCTPQVCSFRDNYTKLRETGATVFGISAQTSEAQVEAANRLHLPYALLSDHLLEFAMALRLPLLEVAGMRLIKRLTLVAKDGIIKKCFYPVFPPDKNVDEVLAWLSTNDV